MPRSSRTRATTRLSIDLTDAQKAVLEMIRFETEADSAAEVIRRAVIIYDLLLKEQASGSRVLIDRKGQMSDLKLY